MEILLGGRLITKNKLLENLGRNIGKAGWGVN
jgi:hypothetical protein